MSLAAKPKIDLVESESLRTKKSAKEETAIHTLPAVPLRGMVSFPFMMLPLFIGREKSVRALEAAAEKDKMLLLVSQRDEANEEPGTADVFEFGTLAEVVQIMKMPDGNVRVVVEGRTRARVLEWVGDEPHMVARIETIEEDATPKSTEVQALARRLKGEFETAVNLSKSIPPEALQTAQSQDKLGPLADLVVSYLEIPVAERQAALENLDPIARAREVAGLLQQELQVLELDKELDAQVREGVGESQREYFLRERLKAIQDKLGDRDSSFKEADQLRERVASVAMTEEARERALSEIDRLEKMPSIAPGSFRDSHLRRTDVRPAVGQAHRRQSRYRAGAGSFRRRPLGAGKNKRPHHRVPRRAQAEPRLQRPDSVFCRAAGRG
jgi:ATP-dependent Lon protease